MVDLNQQSASEGNMREMLQTIWRGKLIIVAVTLLSTAGSLAYYYTTAPQYKAQAVIMVKEPNKERVIKSEGGGSDLSLPTSVELLKSYTIAEVAVQQLLSSENDRKLDLFGNRPVKGKSESATTKAPDEQKTRSYAEELQGQTNVENLRDTNLIQVTVTSQYPDEAALLANTVCEVYQRKDAEWSAAQDISVSKSIEQQIVAQEQKVKQTETALRDFMRNNEVYEATGNVGDLRQAYTAATSEYDSNRIQAEILRKQLAFVDQKLTDEEKSFSRNLYQNLGTKLRSMRDSIKSKENAYVALAVKKGATDPEVQAYRSSLVNMKAQYDQVNRTKIAGEIANSGNDKKYRFDMLSSKMQTTVRLAELDNSAHEYKRLKDYYQGLLNQLPAKQITYAKLNLDHEVATKTYAALKEKLDETRIKAASNVGGISIIKKAFAPSAPDSPILFNNLAAGLGGGLIIGLMLAVAKEKFV
jgi:polysaccharide biosynthesis transport protein